MPKVQSGKKYSKGYSETDLEKALEAIKKGMGKKTAARIFNVPRATLQFRLSKDFVKSRPGPDTVLSSQEESQLVNGIIDSSRKGFPRRKEDVIKSVRLFLEHVPRPNSFIENTPGEGWYKLFLKRHPELSIRTSEAVTSASSKVSESQIRNWFRQIEDYLKENNLFHILGDPSRVYNGDETNFVLCPKNTRVIAPKGEKNVYEVDHAQSKSCITVMFTFSADGEITPPMIIFPLKRMRSEIQKSVPKEWGIGLSDNGWMKAEVFNQYIQNVFHPALQKKNVTFPIILFVDGHKSHTTLQLAQLCQSLGIILIALYPNATRLLQPADVAAFRPIKVMWRKAVLEWRTNNLTKTLLKTDVGPILEKLLPKIKKSVLKNGFEACGLCPFNPDKVDYTKCLIPFKPQQINILDDNSSVNINYQTFQEIIGPQLIRKMKNQIVGKSLEAKKLFEIYKYLVPKNSMHSSSTMTIQSNTSELIQNREYDVYLQIEGNMEQNNDFTINSNYNITKEEHATVDIVSDILGYEINDKDNDVANKVLVTLTDSEIPVSTSPRILSPTNNSLEPELKEAAEIIFEYQKPNDESVSPHLFIQSSTQQNEINNEDIEVAKEVLITTTDSEIPMSNSPKILSPSNDSKVSEPKEAPEIIFEYQKPNDSISPPFCIPSSSRQNVEFVGGTQWKLVDVVPNKNISKTPKKNTFKDFLPLPKTPVKNQKRDTQHRSFVLTSKDWEAAELQKQQQKLEAIQQKDARRKQRLEKAELKCVTKAKKLANNKNKKKTIIKTDNQNITNKAKNDSQNKTNKVIILSNVIVKPANAKNIGNNEEITEAKQIINNLQTIEQEEHKRQPLSTKYEDNMRDLNEKEKLTNDIDNPRTVEQKKPKKMPSTNFQENMKRSAKKYGLKNISDEGMKSSGPIKSLSDKEILKILEEDEDNSR